MLQAHVAVDLIRSAHGLPTTLGCPRFSQSAMVGDSEPPFACHKSVLPSSSRPDHTTLHAQFPSDRSTNLIRSRKHITKHICVGYYHSFSIIMKALRVKFEKCVAKCIFSRFAMLRFKLLQAHVTAHLIRSCPESTTMVGVLRTRQIAMVEESKPPFAYHKSVVSSSNRTDHTTLHAQCSSDQSIHLIHSRKRITKHICAS